MCIDLHTHSIYSDGTATVAELVELAVNSGLHGLSLTDHDTVEGCDELKTLGERAGLVIVSGVEVSTSLHNHTLHILGYGIDTTAPALHHWLLPLQTGREARNAAILEKLAHMGINISPQEIQLLSCCGQTGRPHIARLLVQKGIVDSFDNAFRLYLGRNKPAWESRFSYSAAATIAMIHQVGGLAVLAHPGQLDAEMRVQPQLIRELVNHGLDGLEVYYPTHSKKMTKKLRAIATEHKLLITGGSDFHGVSRPIHQIAGSKQAFCPPATILDDLVARLHRSL